MQLLFEEMIAQALILCIFLVPICIAPNIGDSHQTKQEKCPYKDNKDENGRDLIFIEESLLHGKRRYCCGCPLNKKMVKPCEEGAGKMHTTQCEDCEPGTEISKRAHSQTFCDVIPNWHGAKPNTGEIGILGVQHESGESHPPWYIFLILILLFIIILLLVQLYYKVYKIRCCPSRQKNDVPEVENGQQPNNREDGEIPPLERDDRQPPDRLLEEDEAQQQLLNEIDDASSADGDVYNGRQPELVVEPEPVVEAVVEHEVQGVQNPQPSHQPEYISKAVQTNIFAEAGVQTEDAGDTPFNAPVKQDGVEPLISAGTAPKIDQVTTAEHRSPNYPLHETVPLTHHGPDDSTDNGSEPATKEIGLKKVPVPVRKRHSSSLKVDFSIPEVDVGFDHLEMQLLNGASRETENTQKENTPEQVRSMIFNTRKRTVSQASNDLELSDIEADSDDGKPKKQNQLQVVYDFISGFVDKPQCRSIAVEIDDVIKFGRDFGLNESLLRIKPGEAPHTALYQMLVTVHNTEGNKLTQERVVKAFRKQNNLTLLADEMENFVKEKANSS